MAIIIPHRFIDRLLPNDNTAFIDTVIIGTFNPGLPVIDRLDEAEHLAYKQIQTKRKFQKFNEVMNFYDRPQNRFWKIMDVFANPDFYKNSKDYKDRNTNGLKYYNKLNRVTIFQNQTEFCLKHGIFITDIVRQIATSSFDKIYDNFPDTAIEASVDEWNTKQILNTIKKYKPKRILVNFKESATIPRISSAINEIKAQHQGKVIHVMSTSGAAGNNYKALVDYWHPIIK